MIFWAAAWLGIALAVSWVVGHVLRLGRTEAEQAEEDTDQALFVQLEYLWSLDAKEGRPPGEERPS